MYAAPIIKRLNDDCYGLFPKNPQKGRLLLRLIPCLEIISYPHSMMRIGALKITRRERQKKDRMNYTRNLKKKMKEDYDSVNTEGETSEAPESNTILFQAPPFRIPDDLYDHQKRGLKIWNESGKRGILEYATGSGKTVTAISAIKEHIDSGRNAIVLVPSEPLLFQWHEEIDKFIPYATIEMLGGGEKGGDILNEMRYPSETDQF